MSLSLSMLASEWLIYILLVIALIGLWHSRKIPYLREVWDRLGANRIGMIAATLLAFFVIVALLDSIHFQQQRHKQGITQTVSLLDLVFNGLKHQHERTYSSPFARHEFTRSILRTDDNKEVMGYAPLKYTSDYPASQKIGSALWKAALIGFGCLVILVIGVASLSKKPSSAGFFRKIIVIFRGKTEIAWREILITASLIITLIAFAAFLMFHYHILGTNKVGNDIFYESVKSIRTAVLIGSLTTVFMLPFSLILGMSAGFFGGWIDDIIQYFYTTLSSIPSVLLISATILVMQIYINAHPDWFPTLAARADARLLALCFILGVTSWSNLCRLLRAETLKIRELEFVQAARVLGVRRFVILLRHIMPNIMHIVLITLILDFSTLVLAEAVLSYVGVGVDPTTASWGNMINASRLELARAPMVWWPLLSALSFMFLLVLSANLFSDAVSEALNPRSRQL